MRKFLIGCAMFLIWLYAVSTVPAWGAPPRPAAILNCLAPEGTEYVCYSDEECIEYLKGYSAVFSMKVAKPGDCYGLGQGETHPVVHMNLYYDHKGLTLIGRIEGEKREHPKGGKRWYMQMWTIVCDDNGNILNEEYSEGFRKVKK